MKAAAYARSITDTHAVERQMEEIRRFIARRGWTLVATYSDLTSGTRNNRAGFRQLLAAAARGDFDAVIVQGLDRAAHSSKQLVDTLERLRRCRVAFVSLEEDIDTSTPAGEVVFRVMAAIGRFERTLAGDRIRSGLQRARARGRRVGRPRAPVAPDQVRALRAAGLSYRAIGRQLHVSPALAHRLAREVSPEDRPGRSETSHEGLETGTRLVVHHESSQGMPDPLVSSGDGDR